MENIKNVFKSVSQQNIKFKSAVSEKEFLFLFVGCKRGIQKNNFYLKLCRKDLHSRRHWRYFIRRFQFGSFFSTNNILCFNFSEQCFTMPDRKFMVFIDFSLSILRFYDNFSFEFFTQHF